MFIQSWKDRIISHIGTRYASLSIPFIPQRDLELICQSLILSSDNRCLVVLVQTRIHYRAEADKQTTEKYSPSKRSCRLPRIKKVIRATALVIEYTKEAKKGISKIRYGSSSTLSPRMFVVKVVKKRIYHSFTSFCIIKTNSVLWYPSVRVQVHVLKFKIWLW